MSEVAAQLNNAQQPEWPDIEPLKTALPAVEKFNFNLLPVSMIGWVRDISERVQCPPDFVAVTVMVALSSLIGRKAGIHPKQKDDWLVVPNLWGALIGRPSVMKTPAMAEGLRPLKRLVIEAKSQFQEAALQYEADQAFSDATEKHIKKAIESAVKSKNNEKKAKARDEFLDWQQNQSEPPVERRYIVNDTTVEKLGELLNENANGLLLERDELTGWLKTLDREDRSNDRAFFLEAFNGCGSYTYDRIGRGTVHIDSVTLSLIGGIQPSKLQPYIWNAVNQAAGDDGLIQRFQLSVWPDDVGHWKNVDEWPDSQAKNEAFDVFQRLNELPEPVLDENGHLPAVRFDTEGQEVFSQWRHELEYKVRQPDIHPAIEAHLVKYRSLMPSLALIINEIEVGHMQSVTKQSALKATAWCDYLESHANRIYGGAVHPATQNANTILQRRKKLPNVFTSRDVQRKGWAGLSEASQVRAAIQELEETGHVLPVTETTGGRPSITYRWNPKLKQDEKNENA